VGDTVRWIVGDTTSGAGTTRRVHILVKPTRPDLTTNLIVNTDRRSYLAELRATPTTYMASVSWDYPEDDLIALHRQDSDADDAAPVDAGLDLNALNFRYAIQPVKGGTPPWLPSRAFDDGHKVYIAFPSGIGQGELPPLFVLGADGGPELVNYRVRQNWMIVDRLFAAAELRLGDRHSEQRGMDRAHGWQEVMSGAEERPEGNTGATTSGSGTGPSSPPPSPDLRLRAQRPPVVRLSRPVIWTLGGAGMLAIGLALGYALQNGAQKGPLQGAQDTDTRPSADGLAALPMTIPPPRNSGRLARRSRQADPRCTAERSRGTGFRHGRPAWRSGDRGGTHQQALRADRGAEGQAAQTIPVMATAPGAQASPTGPDQQTGNRAFLQVSPIARRSARIGSYLPPRPICSRPGPSLPRAEHEDQFRSARPDRGACDPERL
jgi:P-type conjugative transfer protein TrbG